MTERELTDAVVELAQHCGWMVHHDRPGLNRRGQWATNIQGDAGFPDLVLVRGGDALFVELKTEKGVVSPGQSHWLHELRQVEAKVVEDSVWFDSEVDRPVRVLVWRPAEWLDGTIDKVLMR